MASQFNHLTEKYLSETDLAHRKALGQYFTPKDLRLHLLSKLPQTRAPRILDPACGSGEFLISAGDYFGECTLHGWEIDPKLVRLSRRVVQNASIKKVDSLTKTCQQQFDFVIQNVLKCVGVLRIRSQGGDVREECCPQLLRYSQSAKGILIV